MFKKNKEKNQDIVTKYEKLKIHTAYIITIAVILAIIGIAIGLGKDYNFAAEISMASTITSIVLSVIAIFMSISGENKFSHAQNQLLETAELMEEVASNIEKHNLKFGTNIEKMDNIGRTLKNIYKGVEDVKQTVTKGKWSDIEDINNIPKEMMYNMLENLVDREKYSEFDESIEKALKFALVSKREKAYVDVGKMAEYLEDECKLKEYGLGFSIGITYVFVSNGIGKEETNKYICEKMQISHEEEKKIKEFLE